MPSWGGAEAQNADLPFAMRPRTLASMRNVVTRLLVACGAYLVGHILNAAAANGPEGFDFTHVDLAIRYFENPSTALIEQISESDAARHLKRHSDRTGYYPADAAPRDITLDLLAKSPSPAALQAVRELTAYVKANPERQQACLTTASSYLPEQAQPTNPPHLTWGYDIGVAMDAHASLNVAHPHFLADRDELWFYCIHEVHHSGLMQIHPMPRVADIDTVLEVYEFVRYATFLEGLAVHAARETRRLQDALAGDPDYIALTDASELAQVMSAYRRKLESLRSEIGRPLGDEHWQVVEEMSSGKRLWYVAGAAMAASIEGASGRGDLLQLELLGPEAFFDAFEELSGRQSE
jgi:hypothetical protein